jgi:ribosomal protein S18 acetylase RimI-like enzyme/predicted double-glycine peptidase
VTANIRPVQLEDLDKLVDLENLCFQGDRISRRSFRHWIKTDRRVFWVAESDGKILAYALVMLLRGIKLARLYSLAVDPEARKMGLAKLLMNAVEEGSTQRGRIFMRLEVAADNHRAIEIYQKAGYRKFGTYEDYYEDHQNAIRMQKLIRVYSDQQHMDERIPWIQQSMTFTCGPTSLMMAMASLSKSYVASQEEELLIWREATTIFMTSGHGGCHPLGLALSAQKRGFHAEVSINQEGPLFSDSVRDLKKKTIVETVHNIFLEQATAQNIDIHYQDITQDNIEDWFNAGKIVLVLISTYRMDGCKAPHWVTVSGIDSECLYVHDPDPVEEDSPLIGGRFLPIARKDFEKMSLYGRSRLRTAIVLSQ